MLRALQEGVNPTIPRNRTMPHSDRNRTGSQLPRYAAAAVLVVLVFLFARPVAVSAQETTGVRAQATVIDATALAEAHDLTRSLKALLRELPRGESLPAPAVEGSVLGWVSEQDGRRTVTVAHLGH